MDLNSTPAESTRFKTRLNKTSDKQHGDKVFKVPGTPSSVKSKPLKIKSVAERKSDLLFKWATGVRQDKIKETGNNSYDVGDNSHEAMSDDNYNLRVASLTNKLARYRYDGEGGINKKIEEDSISLGESAKMTQAKHRKLNSATNEHAGTNDYEVSSREHEHDDSHEESEHEHTSRENSDADTHHTDISAAQSNIAEQAEIAERKELEDMKSRVQGDDDTATVLRYILEKLTMMQIGLKEMKNEQSSLAKKIEVLQGGEVKVRRANNYCLTELQEIATTNFKLIQSTIKQDQDIAALKKQMMGCETKLQKGTITISGIKKIEGEEIRAVADKFFKEKLKLSSIVIKSAYRMTKYKIAIQLLDPNDVALIFKNVSNLKGVKNDDDRFYKIDEFLPDHQFESKTRRRDIKRENSRMPFTHQTVINTEKNKMMVGEGEQKEEWKEPLQPEPVKSYLLMSKLEEETLDGLTMMRGPDASKEGSNFISFAVRVASLEMVKLLYRKLKNEHQMATHVIGAYRIFGKEHHYLQSFCDDGEHGGGRRMLNILKEQGIFNIAVFIVRYKDGANIGKARFEIISELTKKAIARLPHLDRGERKTEDDKETAEALRKAVTWSKVKNNENRQSAT